MQLQLTISDELALRLREVANQQGVSLEAVALQLLEKHLPPRDEWTGLSPEERGAKLEAMFARWEAEEKTSGDEDDYDIFRALDANRGPGRKLFPEEMKGITW